MTHVLSQQVAYLRSALEQEKKPLGFLIGAGAPMAIQPQGKPLIPDLQRLTEIVQADLQDPYLSAVATLVGHLPEADRKNLEALLNYVRSLAALPGREPIRGVNTDLISELDAKICNIVRVNVDATLPVGDTPYAALAIWIGAVRRLLPAQIFTTNYDLLMEQALERQRVAYFDGFIGSREPSFDLEAVEEDQLPTRWTQLWKLHGSINWALTTDGEVIRRAAENADESTALVYPSHLKYDQSRRLPYLAMMDRLKAFLRRPGSVLVSCGFSFRDQHINEVVEQALRGNPTASVHALLHGKLENYPEAVALSNGLPNLILLAADAGVVGTIAGDWAPGMAPEGETPKPTINELGDFEAFGAFLRTLTGEIPARESIHD